jgi:hypothetical protein
MADASPERPTSRTPIRNRHRHALSGLAFLVLAVALVWALQSVVSDKPIENPIPREGDRNFASASDEVLHAKIAPSPFRNASKTVGYVGSQECIECHRAEYESYLQTTHSRSLAEVDVAREPPDGEFFHELSGRHYRIYRDGETLRLREFIQDGDGQEVVMADHVARYSMGSGNYARMYLVQVDDFLVEAPVQWYPRMSSWGMSAGYEKDPRQQGFSREVGSGCLECHVGRVEMVDNDYMRLKVTEMAISCERCHGPGALHVAERRANLPIAGSVDDTIVNLQHLSRERQEDVCSQCHSSGSAGVDVRGRSKSDFRPGLRMSDFHVCYRIDRTELLMAVSGQIEHMRLSRCYQASKTMTCATCHNPHSLPEESEKVEYYRAKCLSCHQTESCRLPVETRREQESQDNCVICHMPRGTTDIPHFSFTHHRVGIHSAQASHEKLNESDQLVPIGDISYFPEDERQRLLGLANSFFATKLASGLDDETRDDPSYRALSKVFLNRAQQILQDLRSRGMDDPDVATFISTGNWRRKPDLCIAEAEAALKSKHISPAIRRTALYNLATSYFDQRQFDKALPYLEELVKIERSETTLMLMGICRERQNNFPEAVRLINAAILDSPDRADLHVYLARIYEKMGQSDDAEKHRDLAKLLKLKVRQPE